MWKVGETTTTTTITRGVGRRGGGGVGHLVNEEWVMFAWGVAIQHKGMKDCDLNPYTNNRESFPMHTMVPMFYVMNRHELCRK